MTAPRQVSPLDRKFEDKLVALVEAVGAQLSRQQIYGRVSDDVDSEEQLAKCLGRLVASGRLTRERRARFGAEDELVYGPAGAPRAATLAAAPPQTAPAPRPTEEEDPMPKAVASNKSQKFVDYLNEQSVWLKPKAIADALDESPSNASYHLNKLAAAKLIKAAGGGATREYASLTVVVQADPAEEKKAARKPRAAPRRAARPPPSPNLADFGARPSLPVPVAVDVAQDVHCAIEDTGLFALNDGKSTIRMKPAAIRKVIGFLELVQHVWKDVA